MNQSQRRREEQKPKRLHLRPDTQSPRIGWTRQRLGAAFGLTAGLVALMFGLLFTAVAWVAQSGHFLKGFGTALLIISLPLLLFGAHCLDASEKQEKAARRPEGNGAGESALDIKGRNFELGLVFALLLYALPGLSAQNARAQQTLFNVPSADVLDEGKVYFELDVSFKPVEPKFSSFVPRVVIGAGRGVEVGLNVTGNIQPGADQTTLVPTIKWKFYDGGENGWALFAGNNLLVPVRNKTYRAGNYAYAAFSRSFKTKTRITAGGYHFTPNVVAPNAQRAGGQFGFEQTVSDKFTAQADWFTGKHANGYFTPGIAYKLRPKVIGYLAYSIGNSGATRGNHFIYAEVGINFN